MISVHPGHVRGKKELCGPRNEPDGDRVGHYGRSRYPSTLGSSYPLEGDSISMTVSVTAETVPSIDA